MTELFAELFQLLLPLPLLGKVTTPPSHAVVDPQKTSEKTSKADFEDFNVFYILLVTIGILVFFCLMGCFFRMLRNREKARERKRKEEERKQKEIEENEQEDLYNPESRLSRDQVDSDSSSDEILPINDDFISDKVLDRIRNKSRQSTTISRQSVAASRQSAAESRQSVAASRQSVVESRHSTAV